MRSAEVFIVGGGPAGLAAAIACRLQGFHVVVADCGRPPIDKPCGEGLMPDAVAALHSLGVTLDPEQTGLFRGIRFVDAGTSVEARFATGVARGVRRTILHEALHQRACGLGVTFLWNTQVLSLELRDECAIVGTATGPVESRWTIGADGLHSRIRLWSGLNRGQPATRRIGIRAHLETAPWNEFVEVHWADEGQAYVTPISSRQIGMAFVARGHRHIRSVDQALHYFPALAERLRHAPRTSVERGAATFTQSFARVTGKRIALIGDASGSVDAVTGEGLGLAFAQAVALAPALRDNNLNAYQKAHREIMRRPARMSRALLLLDRYPALRKPSLRSFSLHPELFEHLLAIHTGELPLTLLGRGGVLALGAQLIRG